MHAFFDSSALVPTLIDEPSSELCKRILTSSELRFSSRLTYVETSAALAKATRIGRITPAEQASAWDVFEETWGYFLLVGTHDTVLRSAARFTQAHALRAYDAVQCASAFAVADEHFCAVSGDRRLLKVWQAEGMRTIDVNRLR